MRHCNNLLDPTQAPRQGVWAWNADHTDYQPLYLAAQSYVGTPTVLFAGINYGAGSSRDWAAKVLSLLGIKAVVARSIERIHRSNLIGMGVLPLVFNDEGTVQDLALDGSERLTFLGLDNLQVGANPITLQIDRVDGGLTQCSLVLRLDSLQELGYLVHGGVLPFVIRKTVQRTRQGALDD